jgi:hypothetical protein
MLLPCRAASRLSKRLTADGGQHALGLLANLKQHARLSEGCLVEATNDNNLSVERNSMST